MIENKLEELERSRITYETLEKHVRMKAQRFIQEILEGEVNHFFREAKIGTNQERNRCSAG